MGAARRLGCRLATAVAAAMPALAVAQARTLPQPVPPGGLSRAWPLGAIVVLVAIVAVLGAWLARRRGGAASGGPRGRR